MISNSFFIFGARGTGKSTFLKQFFSSQKVLWINLLNPEEEDRLSRKPHTLYEQAKKLGGNPEWIVIDEVQKVPALLNVVHQCIEEKLAKFALTGSSARQLKRGSANLLAGRAFVNHLFPLTHVEMGESFLIEDVLNWGSLPKTQNLQSVSEKQAFLRSYALTYLKEEIWSEHVVRRLDPFRKFLEIAAQSSAQIINYSNIAIDVGVDTKTVQAYFEILEDTLVGSLLPAYHGSLRKQQRKNPKFYFFDTGVKRALDKTITQTLLSQTTDYGLAFESFLITECHRLNEYYQKDYSLSYLMTKDHQEIDLLLERPGLPLALIEIKSKTEVDERDVSTLQRFHRDLPHSEAFCFSQDKQPKKIGSVHALPWWQGLKEIGLVR